MNISAYPRRLIAALALSLTAVVSLPAWTAESATRTVTYYGEQKVTLPQTVTRVASAWEAQNSIIAMLGFGPNIVATTRTAKDMPAFRKMVPSIKDVPLASLGGGELNVEELIQLQPQVLFMSKVPAPAQAAQLQRAGIAIASFKANSLSALVERTLISGEILGGEAVARSKAYKAYFEGNVAKVNKALANLPDQQRVSLYHSMGTPLSTSGRPSLNQDWMDLAHVRNVAADWFGGNGSTWADVSIEQVMAADPDIIVSMRASDAQEIRSNAKWRNLRAVKSGRVYANPKGMFWWCRETSEEALQFLWLAKLAYPKHMQDIDMRAETRYFYKTFYHYELSETELEEFLKPTS